MSEVKKEQFEFQAEMSQLLHLITHSLYSHREIFLRELISNSSDALSKIHFESLTDSNVLGEDGELKIKIALDEEKKTFTISDNGLGMSHDELIANIGTIASSGTSKFVTQMTGDKAKDMELIGRFGVGFYAVFMVAAEVTVESRSYKEEKGYRGVYEGTGPITIEEIEKAERGTSISFTLKEDAAEFATKARVEGIIKKYSDYVSFPIELNEEKANQSTALWAKPKEEVTEEEYKEFYKYLSGAYDEPMEWMHLSIEAPVQFKSVLFIPGEADKALFQQDNLDPKVHLYVKKVFIQNDCKELLPQWLRFVKGVVDSEDLTLNVSREVTQHSPIMAKISSFLTKKLLGLFKDWSIKDKEKYLEFYKKFGNFIKEGMHMDFGNKEKLTELYRVASSVEPDGLISLQDYVDRMKPDQEEIYYVSGRSKESIESSPNLEYFKQNGIEVLYLYEDIDNFILPGIGTYKEKAIVGIDKADLNLDNEEKEEEKLSDDQKTGLLAAFKTALGEEVSDVIASNRLVDSACTLTISKDGMDPSMERMMKMMDANFQGAKKVLEVNLAHPLLQSVASILEKQPEDAIIADVAWHLLEGANLLQGELEDPSKMVPRNTQFMKLATELYLKSL